MIELLPEISSEDLDHVEAYWTMRKRYEAVFGKLTVSDALAPGSLPDKRKEMSDKLDAYYRQQPQRTEKRKAELATA